MRLTKVQLSRNPLRTTAEPMDATRRESWQILFFEQTRISGIVKNMASISTGQNLADLQAIRNCANKNFTRNGLSPVNAEILNGDLELISDAALWDVLPRDFSIPVK